MTMTESYCYSSTARKRGFKTFVLGLLLTIICGGIIILILNQNILSPGAVLFFTLSSLFGVIGFLLFLFSFIRIILGGVWKIEVSKDKILWECPKFSEIPFNYKIHEINFLKKQIYKKEKKDGRIKSKIKYCLIAKNGDKHWINNQSGLDIDSFIEALKNVGIELKEEIINKE